MTAPSLDNRWFGYAPVDGEPPSEVVYMFGEEDGEVWATYAGGPVRRGQLVGTRSGDSLDFRYVQLDDLGDTVSGHAVAVISVLPGGLLHLAEAWRRESESGDGTTNLVEISLDLGPVD